MNVSESQRQLTELLGVLREDQLTDEQVVQLDVLLVDHPNLQEIYLDYLQLCCGLRHHQGATDCPIEPNRSQSVIPIKQDNSQPVAHGKPAGRGRGLFAVLSVGAAAILVVAAFSILRPSTPHTSSGIDPDSIGDRSNVTNTDVGVSEDDALMQQSAAVAVLTRTAEVIWADGNRRRQGTRLFSGHLRLKSGLAQVEFLNGAVVILEGPADFELIDSGQAFLHLGKLRSYVPLPARGFSIETPGPKLVDRGTEFGLSVDPQGQTEVHVFEGQVELQKPHAAMLSAGRGLHYDRSGQSRPIDADPLTFVGPARMVQNIRAESLRSRNRWIVDSQRLAADPSLQIYFNFENPDVWGRTLRDRSAGRHHGAIIGCEWTTGRWPGKTALEFKRTTDRVRVNVPGEFSSLTLCAWVRIEGFDRWLSSLLLTDGWDADEVHWQLSDKGKLILGVHHAGGVNYFSPVILGPADLGRWVHLTTVYDHRGALVRHYLDGREVSRQRIQSAGPLRIGPAEIGNWNPGTIRSHPLRSLNGRIDEFAIFDRALKADEIRHIYQMGRP